MDDLSVPLIICMVYVRLLVTIQAFQAGDWSHFSTFVSPQPKAAHVHQTNTDLHLHTTHKSLWPVIWLGSSWWHWVYRMHICEEMAFAKVRCHIAVETKLAIYSCVSLVINLWTANGVCDLLWFHGQVTGVAGVGCVFAYSCCCGLRLCALTCWPLLCYLPLSQPFRFGIEARVHIDPYWRQACSCQHRDARRKSCLTRHSD